MTTTVEKERREQSRWRLLPSMSHLRMPEELVDSEFLTPADRDLQVGAALQKLMQFAGTSVPHYSAALNRAGLKPDDFDRMERLLELPVVSKTQLQEDPSRFRPRTPPRGESTGMVRTSGTTGTPLVMPHSVRSLMTSSLLSQRERRWFRTDPRRKGACIGAPWDLPGMGDGAQVQPRQTVRSDGWMVLSTFFRTGPFVGFSVLNSIEDKVEWLLKENPDYLMSHSGQLEHLALGVAAGERPKALRSIHAISQQLTAGMRATVERAFDVPVHQNYGLNEIGLVASRCPEGARYHVHTEHCLVEIVNEEGELCEPGERGRLLVTALNNAVMPLIRYDTGDVAAPADPAPCPCGRTLPAFVDIVGRYRRIALLPSETWGYWDSFSSTLPECPASFLSPLREYQLHQFLDGSFELRTVSSRPLEPGFYEYVRAEWKDHGGEAAAPLSFREVHGFPLQSGGKFQNFTSDFAPFPEAGE